jgi:hypothetical protein
MFQLDASSLIPPAEQPQVNRVLPSATLQLMSSNFENVC